MADKLKLMLVDDHYLVRMGLASIMALEPDVVVCAEASSGEEARALYRTHRPDVTLMDLRLPDISGTETLQAIRSEYPDARIVMISTYVCDEEIYGALQAGAMAYLVKSVQRDELMRAIRKAAQGQRHIPAEVAARLAERVDPTQLSSRETEVLRLLVGRPPQPGDRAGARHHRGDRQAARQQHPRQAGGDRSDRGGHRALQRGIVQLEM